jgi:transposase
MAVSQWARRLREAPPGSAALERQAKPGRPARLTPRQWQGLLDVLARGAIEAGFETERWTLSRARAVIQRRFGATYTTRYLSARLRELGWSMNEQPRPGAGVSVRPR